MLTFEGTGSDIAVYQLSTQFPTSFYSWLDMGHAVIVAYDTSSLSLCACLKFIPSL